MCGSGRRSLANEKCFSSGELGDTLKRSLAAPAEEGRANQACIEFLANLLKVPRSSVTIASGQTSRRKVIRLAGLVAEDIRQALSFRNNAGEGARATRFERTQ